MPTVTDEYGRKREISREEFLRMLANADPGGITIQEVTTDVYTGKQTVRNIPISRDGSFDLYGARMRFDTPSRSSYTPSEPSEADREHWRRKEEEKRKRDQETRDRMPEELKKIRSQAEQQYGYAEAERAHRALKRKVDTEIARLKKEEASVSDEWEALNAFLTKEGELPLDQKGVVRADLWALMEEYPKLLEEQKTLGLFQLADKKRVRNRMKEIKRILTEARAENMVRSQNISYEINQANIRLQESAGSLSLIKRKIEESLAWREKAVRIYSEDHNRWFRYEHYLLPILEYLEQHDRVTVNEIYENHPHKDEFQSRTIVSYLRTEPSKQFFKEEKSGDGRYFFSLVR